MVHDTIIRTERLVIRQWQEADIQPFAHLHADFRVMEFFPSVKTFEESFKDYENNLAHLKKHGYGWWAVGERKKDNFIGFIGLKYLDYYEALFTPAVEISWKLAYDYWGKGYAREGALATLKYGFEALKLPEIISVTSFPNVRSQRVMERIGMHHDPREDFDHPRLPEGHPLRRHMVYRLKNSKNYMGLKP